VSRVAVLINRRNPAPVNAWGEASAAGAKLGITLQRIEVESGSEFDAAFATIASGGAEALIVVQSSIFDTPPYQAQHLASLHKIPTIYGSRTSPDAGGLMSYGPNVEALYGYAAVFVDRILKGAKPAELPVEQPTKFELVINLKTAMALGLAIPQSLLLRADEVIQ
jgi:putative ABC transport system substrate-binding protein